MRLPFALFMPLALLTLCSAECDLTSPYVAMCKQCCYAQPNERLARQIAPLVALQCPDCRLLSAALCSDLQYDPVTGFTTTLIKYRLILPGGAEVEHCASMFKGGRDSYASFEWNAWLYPPDSLLRPDCPAH